jgi:hypothetical protein
MSGSDMCFKNKWLQVSMVGSLHEAVEEFPYGIAGKVTIPAAPHLHEKDSDETPMNSDGIKIFQVVAKQRFRNIQLQLSGPYLGSWKSEECCSKQAHYISRLDPA